MKLKLIITFLFLILYFGGYSQSTSPKLIKFKKHPCSINQFYNSDKVLFKGLKKDTLSVRIIYTFNCSLEFDDNVIGEIQVNKNSLNLNFKIIEETKFDSLGKPLPQYESDCDCQFLFDYSIINWMKEIPKITIKEKDLALMKNYKVIQGDTLNKIDKNGLRQGLWTSAWKDKKLDGYEIVYKDDLEISKEKFLYTFPQNPNSTVRKYLALKKIYYPESSWLKAEIEYFENGQKKKECLFEKGERRPKVKCSEWDLNGIKLK